VFKNLAFQFRWLLLLAAVLSGISAAAGIGMLTIVTETVNGFESGGFGLPYPFVVFISAVLLVLVTGIASQYILIRLSSIVVFEVQKTLLQRILATKYAAVERVGGHRIISTLEQDVFTIAQGLLTIPGFVFNTITVLLCFGYLLFVSYSLFFFVICLMALLVSVATIVLRSAIKHQEELRLYLDDFFSNMQALTNGGKEIGANGHRKRHFYKVMMLPLFDRIRTKTVKAELLFTSLHSFTTTLFYLLIGLVIYGASSVTNESDPTVVVTFIFIILYLINPLSQLVGMGEEINSVRVSMRKVESLELADLKLFSEKDIDLRIGRKPNWKQISFRSVQFSHEQCKESDEYVFSIGPISTEINAGEITFITGGNGSGKSTFAKLLVGLYSADQGEVFVNGELLGRDISNNDYMHEVSVVFSDFFLFDQLLERDGSPAEDEKVRGLINMLELDGKVSTTNGKLSTTDLSAGQQRRLALLQSYIEDAAVCVFDELAADQDPSFKRYFYNILLPMLKKRGKIIVVISHDENYFDVADKILHFVDGELIDDCDKCSVSGAILDPS